MPFTASEKTIVTDNWVRLNGVDEDGRIAEYLDDGDPLVTAFHDIED